jgi:oxalate---CoA ligase
VANGEQATLGSEPAQTLPALLGALAETDPEAPAILAPGGERLSATALAGRVADVGALLAERGLGRSDRVAVVAGLGPRDAVGLLGVAGRATCVPVNPAAEAELEPVLRRTAAKALLAPCGASDGHREAAQTLGLELLDGLPAEGTPTGGDGPGRLPGMAQPDDVALILRTSGTTGVPKLVPATHRQLAARASQARTALAIGPGDRCLSPMPLCYGHGIYSGLLFSLLTGGSVILPERPDEDSFLEALETLGPTWYTAGATHHAAILGWLRRRGRLPAGRPLRFARCANASLPRETRDELELLLGAPVIETYGTSETGVITSERPGGRRKPGATGTSPGVELAILGEDGARLAPGESGAIAVRGPTVFDGYEGDPELNRRAFADGWFKTGDAGSVDADGFLTIDGRLDDLINRGGEKVAPAEVEAALEEHPGVAEAVVFAVPHRTLGEDLAAAVRPRAGAEPSENGLRAHLTARLARFKVPRRFVLVETLPLGPTGKPLRSSMAAGLGLTAPAGSRGDGEVDLLERRLGCLWGEALEGAEAGPQQDFFDLGGDSLAAVALLGSIEEELDVALELEDLIEAPTPRGLARRIRRVLGRKGDPRRSGRSVVGVNTSGDLAPLFAVPGRPGYALRVLLLGRELGTSQPVYGLQPPGMDWPAAGIRALPEMAAHYLERIREIRPHGPYRLLGSSFGGLLAFEMAVQLERAGEEVDFLGMIDTKPAAFAARHRALWPARWLRRSRKPRGGEAAGPVVAAGTRTAAVHSEARRSYSISDRIAARITLFVCASEGVPAEGERRHLWAEATAGGLRVIQIPGLHAQFDHEPQFSALRDALRSCLTGGDPPATANLASVLGRSYALERRPDGEAIVDAAGTIYRVGEGQIRGRVSPALRRRGKLLLRGWAGDPERGRAGETVVAFLDGRFAGYSTCGAPTEGVARRLGSPGLRHAGFRLWLKPTTAGTGDGPAPRVFALAPDGRASELAGR